MHISNQPFIHSQCEDGLSLFFWHLSMEITMKWLSRLILNKSVPSRTSKIVTYTANVVKLT